MFHVGASTSLCRTSKFGDATNDSSHGSHNSGVSGINFACM